MLNVAGVSEVLLVAAALMAYQAAFGVLLGIRVERKNQLAGRRGLGVVALRGFLAVGVRFAGAVAHFATSDGIGFRRLERGVVRQVELLGFRFVAGLAAFGSRKARAVGGCDAAVIDGGMGASGRVWPKAARERRNTASVQVRVLGLFICAPR